ncbi:sugar ABC transporter permease [Truepera radiovictrix]|uniref:Binding-protein-dependent transport systems inner membrane component n=1 Tax=Truepera radiovictrix (strain DSM 17093 / CIP 108686 / LMG 22925 / RQ-24) TaxID=649638 RepID=D7CW60_TRURR|nr:sugar ABC transporter permease [Truepera radiovictrix]ADI14323.1 binding-protein-dependent transport systems inner membrane component [Truepera radiovictrix DSM 17093]WMT57119.1 sugar ABC transporter permease [Truepera radiovictrix]
MSCSLNRLHPRRLGALPGALLALTCLSHAFAQVDRNRFLIIPYGWLRFLIGFVLIAGGVALASYLYGRATKPGKAGNYAVTAVTHLFIWVVIILTLYPVINLLAVSFNRVNNLNQPPPREGWLLVRAGILPDPNNFSLVQYRTVLSETHLLPIQWVLLGLLLVAGLVLIALNLARRFSFEGRALERASKIAGWALILGAVALVISITNDQFYSINEQGQRVPSGSNRKVVLYIRNTLLVSGITGLFAVLISTTAGYAFARMRFEGRYGVLLAFIFVQMFPGFMALVAIFYLMSYLGLLNTFTGLILAYSGGAIAFASWIFKGYLESISPSLEEAAMVDGATRWGAFWRIILPISVPMLLFIFLLQFIGTYSEFILANTLLTGDDRWTIGIGLRAFTSGQFATQWGTLTASAVLGSLPILIIFYSFQNALTGQYQAGGVKG